MELVKHRFPDLHVLDLSRSSPFKNSNFQPGTKRIYRNIERILVGISRNKNSVFYHKISRKIDDKRNLV